MNKKLKPLDELAIACGFDSEDDMNRMIASIDLSKTSSRTAFQKWKVRNGMKAGLLKLIESKIVDTNESEE